MLPVLIIKNQTLFAQTQTITFTCRTW